MKQDASINNPSSPIITKDRMKDPNVGKIKVVANPIRMTSKIAIRFICWPFNPAKLGDGLGVLWKTVRPCEIAVSPTDDVSCGHWSQFGEIGFSMDRNRVS